MKTKRLEKVDLFERMENELQVLQEQECRMIIGGNNPYGQCDWDKVMNLTYASNAVKLEILETLARDLGINPDNLVVSTLDRNIPAQTIIGNDIQVNMNASLWGGASYYDWALILVHEQNHVDTPLNAPYNNGDVDHNELEAYYAMTQHPYWECASSAFKAEMLKQLNTHLNNLNDRLNAYGDV